MGNLSLDIALFADFIAQVGPGHLLVSSAGGFGHRGDAKAQLFGRPDLDPPAISHAVKAAGGGGVFIARHQIDIKRPGPGGDQTAGRTGRGKRTGQDHDALNIVDLIVDTFDKRGAAADAARNRIDIFDDERLRAAIDVLMAEKIDRPAGAAQDIALGQCIGLGGIEADLGARLAPFSHRRRGIAQFGTI